MLVGVVLLAFVAAIAILGISHQTGWLLTSPRPLFDRGFGQIVARSQSQSNLKQIGIACFNYMGENQDRPPGLTLDGQGTLLHSWQTQLLPFAEYHDLYRQIRLEQPWNHPDQGKVFAQPIRLFLNPRIEPQSVDGYAASYYAGNGSIFGRQNPPPYRQMAAEAGTANIILAGEVVAGFRPWGDPRNLRDPVQGLNRSAATFGGPHPVTQVVMGDGSVRTFSSDTDPDFLELLARHQP